MRDIFEKDFILRVLVPLAGTMLVSGVLYILGNVFLILVALIIFAGLFFFTKYTKDQLEEEIYYEEEDTSPIEEIGKEINKPVDYYEEYEPEPIKPRVSTYDDIKEDYSSSLLDVEDEEGEALHFEKASSLTQQIRTSVDEDYPEPVRRSEKKLVKPKQKKNVNVVSRSMNNIKRKREVPVKNEINYDDDFEFEYGSYDE